MAKIVPFRGIRYNPEQISDLSRVIAPPYDVISPALQDDLYSRHQHNIVRLILGKTGPADSEQNNRYVRAAADFQQWQQTQVLIRDPEPSIYLYDQEYSVDGGETLVRHGIVALSRIEEFSTGLVKPHEKILPEHKADRLQLIKACRANLSPVFALYSDPCCVLEVFCKKEKNRRPDIEVCDDEGGTHRLWRVTESTLIGKVQSVLDNKPLLLADGHHRYEAAIGYRDLMRQNHPDFTGREFFNFVMICFSNMEDRGLQVFPTHRVVHHLPDFSADRLLRELATYFDIDSRALEVTSATAKLEVRQTLAELGRERHVLGLYAGGGVIHYLSLKNDEIMDSYFEAKTPKVLRTLDVSILHRLVFEEVLHLVPGAQESAAHLEFVKGLDEPFRKVEAGEAQLAFLMNPTRVSEVRDVANSGEKMPQKSTYFYPKLLSGLVINKIDEGEYS